jgi:Rieske Fe-S protein
LRAAHIVVATNTPFNDRVKLHTKQAAYRTYVVGFEVPRNSFPPVLLWDMADPYHYVRAVRGEAHDVVIVGGEDHKTGQADDPEMRYQRLESWARARLAGLGAMRYRWSGQLMEPVDALGFIGRNPFDDDNVYVVTGDSGDGMTHGTIAGMLIGDLIAGRANPWQRLYDPARKSIRAAATYVEENANFVGHMVRDWVRGGEVHDRADIPPGEGAIIREGLSTHAVYRDPRGDLHELSAVCTHLGCVVQWNSGEKSWDCPCHGSRFAVDGAVLHGPANSPLPAIQAEAAPPPEGPRQQPRA